MTMADRSGNTTTTMSHTVAGVFNEPRHAEMALNELKDAGFTPEQVSVVAKDTRETKRKNKGFVDWYMKEREHNKQDDKKRKNREAIKRKNDYEYRRNKKCNKWI